MVEIVEDEFQCKMKCSSAPISIHCMVDFFMYSLPTGVISPMVLEAQASLPCPINTELFASLHPSTREAEEKVSGVVRAGSI